MAMACSLFWVISSRARSTLALRSLTVMGTAWSFMDFRLAMDGGRAALHSSAEAAGTTAAAAAMLPVCKKRRRETRVMGDECIATHVTHKTPAKPQVAADSSGLLPAG